MNKEIQFKSNFSNIFTVEADSEVITMVIKFYHAYRTH